MHHVRIGLVVGLVFCLAIPASAQRRAPSPAPITQASGRGHTTLAAFLDSLKLLMLEHGTRVAFQEKTRRELGGPFWADYRHSVRVPAQWEDSDPWPVNYVGHPIHGAAAGYLWLDHEAGTPADISLSKAYWGSRARATAWAGVYSVQFEIGPLSEASIGNVGLRPETTGWVDYVVTPVGALGFMVAEDALDRYFVQMAERHIGNVAVRAVLRVLFNPSRALANTARGRLPWTRADRPIGWR